MIRYIYIFFVGILLAIFIGTGVEVFYKAPAEPEPPTWHTRVEQSEPTAADKKQEAEYVQKQQDYQQEMQAYNRNVSIIVLVAAIVILTISLVFSNRLGAVADGLLLGGIFTLLYGIGRGMASDSNEYRFIAATVGLGVAIVLGYLKFSKQLTDKQKVAKK